MSLRAVVFDFGGVLFDWNPDYLYRKLIPDEAERRWFLEHVCSPAWNLQQDGGRPFGEAEAALIAEHPQHEANIRAFFKRWPETLAGTLADGVALMEALEAADVPLYGLTNWSDETFPYAWAHYPLLHRFRDIVVSGRLKLIKPDPAIYHEMHGRIGRDLPGVAAHELAFIDDNRDNANAATALGWHGIHHTSAARTAERLRQLGLDF
ncbi:HAD family hydrolase [Jeongeupia naejangsanensis]|uniref:HAD-IA family hydrolase n=1 Tax=Jeongeupia naejangsanensis TaxID=613195 RepID=A0ABS2BKR6_9NEIS|nr:HAD-IA family hydrolase [Jeongeupia naejangsanensis]MBM3116045.1 HAD-IA family hydrolase [Jeongeupia naejangsanensis]